MITAHYTSGSSNGLRADMYGLSTDTKPVNVANASTFYEMDTKTLHMFDEENKVWLPQNGG